MQSHGTPSERKSEHTPVEKKPIIIVDVAQTLTYSQTNEKNESIDVYNDSLIDALARMNVRQVYLLMSTGLNLCRTQLARNKISQIMLVEIINYLKKNKIEVIAVISKYDLCKTPFLPGDYYKTVVQPQEQRVLDNPNIDLTDHEHGYSKLITQQEQMETKYELASLKESGIKARLVDLFFLWLKENEKNSENHSESFLFFDDSFASLKEVQETAKKHGMNMDVFHVKKNYDMNNYVDFILKYTSCWTDDHFQNVARLLEKTLKLSSTLPPGTVNDAEIERLFVDANESGNALPFEKFVEHLQTEPIRYREKLLINVFGPEVKGVPEIASIVQSYLPLPPTYELIEEVNQDLTKLRSDILIDWNGVVVSLDLSRISQSLDLSGLQLEGIVFSKIKKNNSQISWLDEWLCWSGDYHSRTIDFSSSNLENAKLENLYCTPLIFANAVLKHASFKWSRLGGVDFTGADLSNADLRFCLAPPPAEFKGVIFTDTNLTHANLHSCIFSGNNFTRTNLNDGDLSESKFDDAIFNLCSMQDADLSNASFKGTQFNQQGERSDLTGVTAIKADFTQAEFGDIIFRDAILRDAILTGATFGTQADLTGAVLSGAQYVPGQFTKEQVLSFQLEPNARIYISAIYLYMEENDESKHQRGFDRARKLIKSLIDVNDDQNGQNKLLTGFLLTGKLPGEGNYAAMFPSSDKGHISLRARLLDVQKRIQGLEASAASVVSSVPSLSASQEG